MTQGSTSMDNCLTFNSAYTLTKEEELDLLQHNTVQHTTVKITKEDNYGDLPLPHYESKGAACMDLYAVIDSKELIIPPNEKATISTGLRMEIPEGYEVEIRPRSGLSTRKGLIMPNSPGTIDSKV